MGDITEEEKLRIANQFILNAPPGEFNEVVTDVRKILNDDALLNRTALQTFRQHNTENFATAAAADIPHKVMVTAHNEVDTKHYKDYRAGVVFKFDHVKQEVVETRPLDESERVPEAEAFRAAIDASLSKYVYNYYPDGTLGVFPVRVDDEIEIHICISAVRLNPTNFWNGQYRSYYHFKYRPGAATAKMSGLIKCLVHYYEDGNVQLNTKTERNADVKVSDSSAAEAITKQIQEWESGFQTGLDSSTQNLLELSFKGLRRKLPISGTKFNFNQIGQHKVIGELNSK
jgi:capping protein alpha